MMWVPFPIAKNCIFADNSDKRIYIISIDYEKKTLSE